MQKYNKNLKKRTLFFEKKDKKQKNGLNSWFSPFVMKSFFVS